MSAFELLTVQTHSHVTDLPTTNKKNSCGQTFHKCIENMGISNILGLFFQATQDTIGFVGLGNMGNHMARNLVKKGYKLVIYDVSKDAVGSLKEDGNL